MIVYKPEDFLDEAAPEFLVKKLVNKSLTLNRAVLSTLSRTSTLTKKSLEQVALKVLKAYRAKYTDEREAGASRPEALAEAVNDKKLMVQRVQNEIITEVADNIRTVYGGEKYIWLPSSAEVPDPLHQLNYGKKFRIGKGEMPGDRFGCKCGMQILVKETQFNLED